VVLAAGGPGGDGRIDALKALCETIGDRSMRSSVARATESGRRALFTALRPFITGDEDVAYTTLASNLGMSPGAVRVAVHRLRQQCGRSLRTIIADTVADVDDVDGELEYLLRVLSEPQ
jgi:hypothetical protein